MRAADTQGIMLGALLMPWTFLALTSFQSRQGITAGKFPDLRALDVVLPKHCSVCCTCFLLHWSWELEGLQSVAAVL